MSVARRLDWAVLVLAVACTPGSREKPPEDSGPISTPIDIDGDGWSPPEDCNDGEGTIHPGAEEAAADGIDQDCDGLELCYLDEDGDGYGGAPALSEDLGCAGDGWAGVDGDCDGGDAEIHPLATETCDGEDDDCDGRVDEGVLSTWYPDDDGDGFGTGYGSTEACEAPEGFVAEEGDCDDEDPSVYPDAEEIVASGVDEDCDGLELCYSDLDDDGFAGDGLVLSSRRDCGGSGVDNEPTDCDDTDPAIYPGAVETCDGVDQDCNLDVDDITWCLDADADGYGDPGSCVVAGCEGVVGFAADATDCDDTRADINPGQGDILDDGIDQDCDGYAAATPATRYVDLDGDGFGDADLRDEFDVESTYLVLVGGDCDDRNAGIYEGAPELCDGLDNDCDGEVDEETVDADVTEACFCSDGVDNDADGLLDCEDADCLDADACRELDCDDGLDDDGDGLIDCEDEDCWGEAGSPECDDVGVRTRLLGGWRLTREVLVAHGARGGGYSEWSGWMGSEFRSRHEYRRYLWSVWGTVQTASSTCLWSYAAATAGSVHERLVDTHSGTGIRTSDYSLMSRRRQGLEVFGRCRVARTSQILPAYVLNGRFGDYTMGYLYPPSGAWYRAGRVGDVTTLFDIAETSRYSYEDSEPWPEGGSIWHSSSQRALARSYVSSLTVGTVWSPELDWR